MLFFKFFDEEMITRIHFETNLYCTQKGKVGNVTKEEIMVFFGINIIMAYHRLPAIRHYWMTSDDMGVKSVQNAMTRDRFTFILGKLHLNDNSKIGPSNKEKLWKLKPVVERMNVLCQNNKIPAEHLSIDESMIRFKGRSSLKQYNLKKPIKRGYKLWCLAGNDGYVYCFDIYTGKKDSNVNTLKDFGLGGQVVMDLTSQLGLSGRNHKVTFDNFFSSIPFMEALQKEKVLACGTIRSTRKDFTTLAPDKNLKRGDFDYRCSTTGVSVYKWRDNCQVHFISNYHKIDATTVKRKKRDGSKCTFACPSVVKDYNANMVGVDTHDMLRQLYGEIGKV